MVKNLPANADDTEDVGKIPSKWQPAPGFWPGKLHGQRSLVGYSPLGCKESYTAEHVCVHSYADKAYEMIQEFFYGRIS